MNCRNVADLLDEHGMAFMRSAGFAGERADVECHVRHCADCGAAFAALRLLAADRVPDYAGAAEFAPAPVRRRRAWRRAVPLFVALGLGGAVFAGVALVRLSNQHSDRVPAAIAGDPGPAGSGSGTAPDGAASVAGGAALVTERLFGEIRSEEEAEQAAFSSEILNAGVQPEGEYFSLLRLAPKYPPAAAERRLEGSAIVEFTITAAGDVENVSVVESSDPVFEAPSVEVARKVKYKPRVVDGEARSVSGVRTIYRYELAPPAPAGGDPAGGGKAVGDAPATSRATLSAYDFSRLLGPVYECLQRLDLQCMELELDVIASSESLDDEQRSQVANIYGYIHYRRGRYDQAIEDYLASAHSADGTVEPQRAYKLMTAAQLQYQLRQYQAALDTQIEYLKATPRPRPADYLFVDKLRELGAVVR